MSDLEDDILMAFIKQGRQIESMKERNELLDEVWSNLDRVLRKILLQPELVKIAEKELQQLKDSVVAVLDFDAKHKDGPNA